jgi:hypothetical protein
MPHICNQCSAPCGTFAFDPVIHVCCYKLCGAWADGLNCVHANVHADVIASNPRKCSCFDVLGDVHSGYTTNAGPMALMLWLNLVI